MGDGFKWGSFGLNRAALVQIRLNNWVNSVHFGGRLIGGL